MGNTLAAPVVAQQDLPTLLLDVPQYLHHSVLGGGKIFKTLQCLHEDGYVVLKLYVRRAGDADLRRYEARLEDLRLRLPLSSTPSILNLVKLEITDRCVYLGRQYMGQSLVERFQVHPRLTRVERAWLAYQMLSGVSQLHARGVRHGDIKTDNFVLTSWGWAFLVDIAFYKPTFLPGDNPADYHFFFDSQGSMGSHGMITQTARRRCYLAPERFYSQITERAFLDPAEGGGSGGSDGQVTEAMDVFSLGCVIAELYLNGEGVLFDLPLLLAYRDGEYDPAPVIAKIPYPEVRALIRHMIQRDPNRRWSAKAYMREWSKEGGAILAAEQAANAAAAAAAATSPASAPATSAASHLASTPHSATHASSSLSVEGASGLLSPTASAATLAATAAASVSTPPLFPPYFPYLYRFCAKLLHPELADPDIKIQALKSHRDTVMREVLGREFVPHKAESAAPTAPTAAPQRRAPAGRELGEELARFAQQLGASTRGGLAPLEQLQAARVAETADSADALSTAASAAVAGSSGAAAATRATPSGTNAAPSPQLNPTSAPSSATLAELASAALAAGDMAMAPLSLGDAVTPASAHGDGLTMICSLICSCLQSVRYPITKLTALELLVDFGAHVSDEVRLGRLIPYAVALLSDPSSSVRASAVHAITKLAAAVNSHTGGSDAHLFPEYIFPALSRFPSDPEEIVRLSYAQCIATLAECSKKLLDLAQQAKHAGAQAIAIAAAAAAAGGNNNLAPPPSSPLVSPDPFASPSPSPLAPSASPSPPSLSIAPLDGSYSTDLCALQDLVLKLVIDMLTVGGSRVKRALLADITRLCVFMGQRRFNNDLLPHLITVLNDRDWQLRSAFFEYIVGVSLFVGRMSFHSFVLPCIEQALFDHDEFVVQRAVHAMAAITQLALFEKRQMIDVAGMIAPLLCHPSAWIRHEALRLMAYMARNMGRARAHAFLWPILRPFIRTPGSGSDGVALNAESVRLLPLTEECVVQFLKQPLSRDEFYSLIALAAAETNKSKDKGAAEALNAQASPKLVAESYAGPARLLEQAAPSSWSESAGTMPGSASALRKPAPLATDGDESLSNMSSAPTDRMQVDPALRAGMWPYIKRLSQTLQTKGLGVPVAGAQSPSSSGDLRAPGLGGGSLDDESLLLDLQNLSLSGSLDDQAPLHELLVEPTVPELAAPALQPGDRATQETFESLGIAPGATNMPARRSIPGDPSLAPQGRAVVATAGATQGGHPLAVRENPATVAEYVKRALDVPAPPPNFGALRADWTSHSPFYGSRRVLHAELSSHAHAHDPRLWRPKGVLVATLSEHAHVRTLATSRDNLFLASAGDEGVVKVWDSQRLKLTAHARSQLSYTHGAPVSSLAVLDSSHAVASAGMDGSVHVFKVEYAGGEDVASRYIGLSEIRRVPPGDEGAVLRVAHFNTLTESLLVYASQRRLHGWDLRSKHAAFSIPIDNALGLTTALDVGPSPHALLTGTARGFVALWDVRFQMPLQMWRHSAATAITHLSACDAPSVLPPDPATGAAAHPIRAPLFFAAAEGSGQIAGFDVYTGESRMLLRVASGGALSASLAQPSRKSVALGSGHTPQKQSVIGSLPSRQKVSVSPLSLPSLRSYMRSEGAGVASPYSLVSSASPFSALMNVSLDEGFVREFSQLGPDPSQSLANGSNGSSNGNGSHSITGFLLCHESFAITAGTDRRVRFWDLRDPADSYRISGDDLSEGDYLRYASRVENSTVVFEEQLSRNGLQPTHAHSGAPTSGATSSAANAAAGGASGASPFIRTGGAPDPRAEEAERLRLKLAQSRKKHSHAAPSTVHTSDIVDLKALEFPQKMIATASRDGIIKIWI